MNKTAKIIIGILVLVSAFFLLFAQIKTAEAQKQAKAAIEAQREAETLRIEAEQLTARAARIAADAVEAHYEAESARQELQECKDSK